MSETQRRPAPTLVLALDSTKAKRWIGENVIAERQRNFLYGEHSEAIRGREFGAIVLVVGFGARSDAKELLEIAQAYLR